MNRGRFDEYAERLTKIAWFSKTGEPSPSYEVAATDWMSARLMMYADFFGEQLMYAQNLLSSHLSRNFRDEYHAWNEVVELVRAKLHAEKDKIAAAVRVEAERELVWKRSRTFLFLAFIEAWYSDLALPDMRFGRELFAVFEAGRLPCGYDGDFPKGKFQVY